MDDSIRQEEKDDLLIALIENCGTEEELTTVIGLLTKIQSKLREELIEKAWNAPPQNEWVN